ncbi:MAG: TonB-dependent receptor [Saprospiraceae bacterium]
MKNLLILPFLIGLINFSYAQQGTLAGTIVDEKSGETLIGANVLIEGTAIGTATDFDGKYQFNTEPGIYTIHISYIGFIDKKVENVEIKANETTYLNIAVSDEAFELNLDVVVKAKAIERSENAILMLQKKSDKIQDGISSQEISRLGAGDAASALKKVTGTTIVDGKYVYVRGLGDRYSTTALNGTRLPSIDPYRNSAQLDLIPSNLLDNIIASKSFTPDLPGDFTGGYVNIKIKTLPERFTYGVSVSSSYNTQSAYIDNFLTFNAGEQAKYGYNDGVLNKPEALNNPKLEETGILSRSASTLARRDNELAALLDGAAKSFNTQMTPTLSNVGPNYSLSFNIGNQIKAGTVPIGLLFAANFSRDFTHYSDALNANYRYLGGNTDELQETFNLRDTRSQAEANVGGLFGLSIRPSSYNEISFYAIYSHQGMQEARFLNGNYRNFGISEPLESFESRTLGFRERELVDFVANGSHVLPSFGNVKIEWAGNIVKTTQDEPDLRFFANTALLEQDRYSISTAQYLSPGHYFRTLVDDSYEAKVDITIPIAQARNKANKIKIGGLYTATERDFSENIYNILRSQGNVYDGDADAYFGPQNTGVVATTDTRNTIGLFIADDTQAANNYFGNTSIWATYGMMTYQLSAPLKVIFGARVEGTDYYVESEAAKLNPNPENFIGDINEVDILPALHFIYALNDDMNLRASYSNTLARPNMREIAPFGSFGFIGDPTVFGNPNLTRSRVNNLDLRYEYFMKPGEMFAVSGFYKTFKDPIVMTFRPAGNPQFTWVNSSDANLYGAEIEFRKALDFISPKLARFSFSGNLAFIVSEVALDEEELARARDVDPNFADTREFAGQSPLVANANLSYTDNSKGWDAILAYNYFGDRLFSTGVEGTPDIFERGRAQLDFSVSKKIGRFQVKLRGQNLLDPNYETFSEFRGTEYIYSRYKRGGTYSVGLSYGF